MRVGSGNPRSVDDHVAPITVADPDRRNAVTKEISAALRASVDAAEANPDVHALIVTGAGKAIRAGADRTARGETTEDRLHGIYDASLRSRTARCRRSPRSTALLWARG